MSIRTPDEEWAVIEHPWTAPAPGGLARPGIDWRGVVIHQTEGSDGPGLETDNIREYHKNEKHWSDVGYTFVVELIERGYEVVVGRPMNRVGAHCRGYNSVYLGVALAGSFNTQPPPAGQLAKAAEFVSALMDGLQIPRDRLYYHRELCDTNCPGKSFPEVEFREMVARA